MAKDAHHRKTSHLGVTTEWPRVIRSGLCAALCGVAVLVLSPAVSATAGQTTSASVIATTTGDLKISDSDLATVAGEIGGAPVDRFGFDIDLTTDTEVIRMRYDVMFALLTAKVQVEMTGHRVEEGREVHEEAVDDLERAVLELDAIDDALSEAAIDGFMNDRLEATGLDPVGSSLEAIAGNTTSGFTTEFLLLERERATENRDVAEQAERDAQQTLRIAEKALSASIVERDDRREDVDTFEVLAGQHYVATERADAAANAMSDEIDLQSVAGSIIVNATIEPDVDRLIADARRDGVDLGGHGFRTFEQQISLRLINCGGGLAGDPNSGSLMAQDSAEGAPSAETDSESAEPSAAELQARYDYIVFEMPPGSCSPPTAKPGTSEHEGGLAIDFSEDGSILTSSSPAFAWMTEHAQDYGLLNLLGEPWHWSTTGH